jgi:hypothetical protein
LKQHTEIEYKPTKAEIIAAMCQSGGIVRSAVRASDRITPAEHAVLTTAVLKGFPNAPLSLEAVEHLEDILRRVLQDRYDSFCQQAIREVRRKREELEKRVRGKYPPSTKKSLLLIVRIPLIRRLWESIDESDNFFMVAFIRPILWLPVLLLYLVILPPALLFVILRGIYRAFRALDRHTRTVYIVFLIVIAGFVGLYFLYDKVLRFWIFG